MNPRIIEFITGIETSVQPDAGTPTDNNDVITLSYVTASMSLKRRVTSSFASPYSAVAGTSIAHGLLATEDSCLMFLKGSSGAVDMSANPQIAVGTRNGQVLELIFTSDTDTVLLENGNGLAMPQGSIRSKAGTIMRFHWDNGSSLWRNSYWNNIGDIS